MASFGLGRIDQFDPVKDNFENYAERLEQYFIANDVAAAKQKAVFLSVIGAETYDLLKNIIAPDKPIDKDFVFLKTKLSQHFKPKPIITFERFKFHNLKQGDNQSISDFVTCLRKVARNCEFGTFLDDSLRDRFVCGLKNIHIQQRLLSIDDLSLDKAVKISLSMESAETNSLHLHKVEEASNYTAKVSAATSNRRDSKPLSCFRCGRLDHMARDVRCPARDKTCDRCGLKGHFRKFCRTKNIQDKETDNVYNKNKTVKQDKRNKNFVRALDLDLDSDQDDYVFMLNNNLVDPIYIDVGGVKLQFMIDSGASVNIIDKSTFEFLQQKGFKGKILRVDKQIFPYGSKTPLNLCCKFSTCISCNDLCVDCDFYVLEGEDAPILSRSAAIALQLLTLPGNVFVLENSDSFSDVFSGLGKLKNYKMKLHIDAEVSPVAQRPYRIPYKMREKVSKSINELEEMDIIEKVNGPSSWVSPIIAVPKANGDVRIVVDMRQANKAIIRERHPIASVEDILYSLNGGKIFSKLDLNQAFHQIELEEESRNITTFVTHQGLYRYKRLMFGVSAAPEMYNHILGQVLAGLEGVQNLYDDIVVFGEDEAEHDVALQQVLQRLRENNLTLNKDKCVFKMNEIQFMGHIISKHGIGPTQERVKALKEAKKPRNQAEVRSFLGVVNFSARYIPNLATIAEPLRRLTRKGVDFMWGDKEEKSFQTLITSLTSEPILGHFNLKSQKTMLICDASDVGLCGILIQEQDGETKVISYASRGLSYAEKRYSTTEKEALACVWACEKFHMYLYSLDFELLTDHKALESIFKPKSKPCARIERWVLRLMPYRFTVKAIPGKVNIADYLSRLTHISKLRSSGQESDLFVKFIAVEATPKGITTRQIEEASREDEELSAVRQCISVNKWDNSCKYFLPMKDELMSVGYVVLRGHRLVIPSSLRKQCIEIAHQGHQGVVKTKQRLRTKVWWPQMDRDVESHIKACHGCQLVSLTEAPEPLTPSPLPNGPWEDLCLDFMGPLDNGHYILVVSDYYSRYFEAEITKDTTSKKVISSLRKMFCTHGLPKTIKTDNAPNLNSQELKYFFEENGITHKNSTPLHPQANGQVERQNRSLLKRIKIAKAESKDWKQEIQQYIFSYRTTPHSVTGVTPAELMFGRKLRTKLPQVDTSMFGDENIRDQDMAVKYQNKTYIDSKRQAKTSDLQVGDKVLVKQPVNSKMDTPYYPEPFTLVKKNGNSCTIQSPTGVNYKRNNTHLRKYFSSVDVDHTDHIHSDHDHDDYPETDFVQDTELPSGKFNCNDVPDKNVSKSPQPPLLSRPQRERKLPSRYKDFVIDKR